MFKFLKTGKLLDDISFSSIVPSDILFISLHNIIPLDNTVNISSVSGLIGKMEDDE